jgi:hypothetical protein
MGLAKGSDVISRIESISFSCADDLCGTPPVSNQGLGQFLRGCSKEVSARLKPVGDGSGDDTAFERCLNVITSIPYGLCGVHAIRTRRSVHGKVWGWSLVLVAGGASLFHASKSRIFPKRARSLTRKLDYWLITASTVSLLKAIHPNLPPTVALSTLASLPFEPFKISAANIAAMEIEFARRAYKSGNDALKRSFHRQLAAAVVGSVLFFAEDCPSLVDDSLPNLPLVHAGWHCLSAYATAECNALLKEVEANDTKKGF